MEKVQQAPIGVVEILGESFYLFLKRSRGVLLYANRDRSKYLRLGDPELIGKELTFHKELLRTGVPVARILEEGVFQTFKYWIEESLGQDHFGTHFQKECETNGSISNELFVSFLNIVERVSAAQAKASKIETHEFSYLSPGNSIIDRIAKELPNEKGRLTAIENKIRLDLNGYPITLTHGDFSAHNTLERGVIDFGDHFYGPLGYDLITAVTAPFWFPKDHRFGKFSRGYDFTERQIETLFKEAGTYKTSQGTVDALTKFDSNFFLRATWWSMGNDFAPDLQTWRFERYLALVNEAEKGVSLYDYWIQNRNT